MIGGDVAGGLLSRTTLRDSVCALGDRALAVAVATASASSLWRRGYVSTPARLGSDRSTLRLTRTHWAAGEALCMRRLYWIVYCRRELLSKIHGLCDGALGPRLAEHEKKNRRLLRISEEFKSLKRRRWIVPLFMDCGASDCCCRMVFSSGLGYGNCVTFSCTNWPTSNGGTWRPTG